MPKKPLRNTLFKRGNFLYSEEGTNSEKIPDAEYFSSVSHSMLMKDPVAARAVSASGPEEHTGGQRKRERAKSVKLGKHAPESGAESYPAGQNPFRTYAYRLRGEVSSDFCSANKLDRNFNQTRTATVR